MRPDGPGVIRPDHSWHLKDLPSDGVEDHGFSFGDFGDYPVVGDWNGDGRDDFGVFDSKTATWTLKYGAETGPANAGIFRRNAVCSGPR